MKITYKNLHNIISKLCFAEINISELRKNLDIVYLEEHFKLCFGQGEYFVIDEDLFRRDDIVCSVTLKSALETLLDKNFELKIKNSFMKLLKGALNE